MDNNTFLSITGINQEDYYDENHTIGIPKTAINSGIISETQDRTMSTNDYLSNKGIIAKRYRLKK